VIRLLRWIAVAIAVAAAIDPPMTVSARVRPVVSIVGDAGSVSRALSREYTIVSGLDTTAAAIVVSGDRYPAVAIPEQARVSTVSVAPADVRVIALTAPRTVPIGTTIHIDAELAGRKGITSEVTASIGAATLARASRTWNDDRPWRASFDVVPIGEPPFSVVLRAGGNAEPLATAVVDVAGRMPVMVYEARPSWATTFLRRALEGDPRFSVSGFDLASRGVTVRTGEAPAGLRRADLDRFRVVIVGGLDQLSAADAAALEQYMTEDGGAVALVPDARVDSAAARVLIPGAPGKETLLEKPAALVTEAPLPRIDASELLHLAPPPDARVLARTSDAPIVWTVPRGEGQLLVSGALDAWRFRGASPFDGFWQSAIAGLALAVHPPLSVDVLPPELPGGDSRVRVRLRGAGAETSVAATLASGPTVRLWPDAERGSFSGVLSPARSGPDRIDVVATSGGRTERASARFVSGAHVAIAPIVTLALLSATHGGVDVAPGNLEPLNRWLRQTVEAKRVTQQSHPMWSPWWIVPFAGCLSVEWWFRRRRGLR
jgi:hypothetical protein